MPFAGEASAASFPPRLAGKRILVLFEPGPAGVTAVELARGVAEHGEATVTVVCIAPQAPLMRGCGPSAAPYNDAVRDTVAHELAQAQELLSPIGDRAACRLLVEGADPPLAELVERERFDLVLLPARRRPLRSAKHPALAALSGLGAEVRVIAPGTTPAP